MKKEKELLIGIGTHAHSVMDYDVHYNHSSIFEEWAQVYALKMIGYKGLLAADARELICNISIEEKCSHLFILDADHLIPKETLEYLLESKDEAIISGLICRKFYPYAQVVWGKDDEHNTYLPVELPLDGKIYEVGVCCFGCTLINLEKLQELEKPWFRDTCAPKADGKCKNIRSDINLCDAFRANGEKVWVDTRILVGHSGVNLWIYPQNAKDLKAFDHQYRESFKLKAGEVGKYNTPSRLL